MTRRHDPLLNEIERTMNTFLATATDEEFWAALEDADRGVSSEIDHPALDRSVGVSGRYSITVKQVANPIGAGPILSYNNVCLADSLNAANTNELALAA
jgi:hypothetical protein